MRRGLTGAALLALLALGCRNPPAEVAPPAEPPPVNDSNGMETMRWSIPDDRGELDVLLDSSAPPPGLSARVDARLRGNGLILRRLPVADLERLVVACGGATGTIRTWHGQMATWRDLMQAPLNGRRAFLVDGRIEQLGPGALRLQLRGWTVPTESGGVLDAELVVTAQDSTEPAHRPSVEPLSLRGEALPGCSVAWSLERGFVDVLTSAPTPAAGSSSGPPGDLPLSVGGFLLGQRAATDESGRRSVLLLLPAIPDAMFKSPSG